MIVFSFGPKDVNYIHFIDLDLPNNPNPYESFAARSAWNWLWYK